MKKLPEYDLLVVGDLIYDFLGTVPSFPEADDEVEISKLDGYLGGSGANFAVDATRLGLKIAFFSTVGSDIYADTLIELLENAGLSTQFIKHVEHQASGVVFGMIQTDGVRRLFCHRGANLALAPQDIPDSAIKNSGRVHLSGPAYSVAESVLNRSRQMNVPNSLDPGMILIRQHKDEMDALLSVTDIIFLNHVELNALTEDENCTAKGMTEWERATRLLKKGVRQVVLKRGELGSQLFQNGSAPLSMSAFKINAVDTTGAGDAFDAGFLCGLHRGFDLLEAMKLANALGAINATAFGATTHAPSFEQAFQFMTETQQIG